MRIRPLIVLSLLLCPALAEASGRGGANSLWESFEAQWSRLRTRDASRDTSRPIIRPGGENLGGEGIREGERGVVAPPVDGAAIQLTYALPYGYGGFRRTGATNALAFFIDTELDRRRRGGGALLLASEATADGESSPSGRTTPSTLDGDDDDGEELGGLSLSVANDGSAPGAAPLAGGAVPKDAFPCTSLSAFGPEVQGGEVISPDLGRVDVKQGVEDQ